jgi:DNA-binding MarR family transcriptional regulator
VLEQREHDGARKLFEALGHVVAATSPVLPVPSLRILTLLAQADAPTMCRIADALHGKRSTISRRLLDMGRSRRCGSVGHGLVYSINHPSVPCAKSYLLTTKGRALVDRLASSLGSS